MHLSCHDLQQVNTLLSYFGQILDHIFRGYFYIHSLAMISTFWTLMPQGQQSVSVHHCC